MDVRVEAGGPAARCCPARPREKIGPGYVAPGRTWSSPLNPWRRGATAMTLPRRSRRDKTAWLAELTTRIELGIQAKIAMAWAKLVEAKAAKAQSKLAEFEALKLQARALVAEAEALADEGDTAIAEAAADRN